MSKWWISQEVGGVVWHLMPSYTSIGEFIFDLHFVMYTLHDGCLHTCMYNFINKLHVCYVCSSTL